MSSLPSLCTKRQGRESRGEWKRHKTGAVSHESFIGLQSRSSFVYARLPHVPGFSRSSCCPLASAHAPCHLPSAHSHFQSQVHPGPLQLSFQGDGRFPFGPFLLCAMRCFIYLAAKGKSLSVIPSPRSLAGAFSSQGLLRDHMRVKEKREEAERESRAKQSPTFQRSVSAAVTVPLLSRLLHRLASPNHLNTHNGSATCARFCVPKLHHSSQDCLHKTRQDIQTDGQLDVFVAIVAKSVHPVTLTVHANG